MVTSVIQECAEIYLNTMETQRSFDPSLGHPGGVLHIALPPQVRAYSAVTGSRLLTPVVQGAEGGLSCTLASYHGLDLGRMREIADPVAATRTRQCSTHAG